MKFTFFIFLSFFQIICPAQNYTPLLDHRNEWHLINCYQGDCFRDIYYTDGDTIVNGQNHKILDGYHFISRTFLLHENIIERKVFLTTTIDGHVDQMLLYDFNLEEGDSINLFNPITPFPENGGYFKLDSIRIKPIINDNSGKYFYFSPTPSNVESQGYYPIWVEGLGSLSIINAPGGNPDYNGVGKVSCFFKNDDLFYFDDEMTDDCNSVMSTHSIAENHLDIKFTVHNFKGILKGKQLFDKIEIYDLTGKRYLSKSFPKKEFLEFNLNFLNRGIYHLIVYSEKKVGRFTFILK